MMELCKPDYHRSVLNIVSSVLEYYGISRPYPSLIELHDALKKKPESIVLIVMDGMGVDALNHHFPEDSFLRRHMVAPLTSVYPCTTTAAMTSYYSGLSPLEHGWLGWSLYFKEYGRTVDTFVNLDTYDKAPVGSLHAAQTLLDHKTVFDRITEVSKGSVQTYTVMPVGIEVAKAPNINMSSPDLESFGKNIAKALKAKGPSYIMAYWYEPDLTMHKTGCYSASTQNCLNNIQDSLEKLIAKAKDTLFIISADHGLTDITETYYINAYDDLAECLIMPPFIEPRCSSFFIKPHKKMLFEERFKEHFGNDFYLMTGKAFVEAGYMGGGIQHPKVDDFIGDYMAIGTGQKLLKYKALNQVVDHDFKGHHAGMRTEEMMVPLIIVET